MEGHLSSAQRPHSSRVPPQSASCMHVYICICDFYLSLFCVFVDGSQKCLKLAEEGHSPPTVPGETGHSF